MSTVAQEFVMPTVQAGSFVLVSGDPDYQSPVLGMVVRVKRTNIDVLVILPRGLDFWENVRHRSDPRVKELREMILSTSNTGVFELSEREIQLQTLFNQCVGMQELETRLAALEKRLTTLDGEENGSKPGIRKKGNFEKPIPNQS